MSHALVHMSSCMNDNEINALLKRLGCPYTIEECRASSKYESLIDEGMKMPGKWLKEVKPVKKAVKVKYAVMGRPIEERSTLFEAKPSAKPSANKAIIVKALKEEAGKEEGFDVIEILEEE